MNRERPTSRDVERAIQGEIALLLVERGQPGARVGRDDRLDEIGLASSDLVRLVANLAATLGVDPFRRIASITDVRTVGDLCRAYERALEGQASEPLHVDELLAYQREAEARRARRSGSA